MDDGITASAVPVVAGLSVVAAALDWMPTLAASGLAGSVATDLAVVALVTFAQPVGEGEELPGKETLVVE